MAPFDAAVKIRTAPNHISRIRKKTPPGDTVKDDHDKTTSFLWAGSDHMTEKKPRILIAEDFEDNRIALKLLLNHAGYEVIEAEDGRAAVEAVQRDKPDLVLMDITLPVVDGLQATREIRNHGEFERLPIIIVSAHDNEDIRRQAIEAGGSEYISKPIEIEKLKKLIEGCLTSD